MLVEFVGGSGVGKSTLIARVLSRLVEDRQSVELSGDALCQSSLVRFIRHEGLRNAWYCITVFPTYLALLRHSPELRETLKIPVKCVGWERVDRIRSNVRLVGCHRRLVDTAKNTTVLVDEGILASVNNPFVSSDWAPDYSSLEQFADSVPLPDRIIHVVAAPDIVRSRTAKRMDKPRCLRGRGERDQRLFLERGLDTFERLTRHARIAGRTLRIDTSDESGVATEANVGRILKHLGMRTR